MALFDSMEQDNQQPQKNQYLQSDPNTDANANTSWMSPSDNTGKSSGNVAQSQPNPPSQVSNGTMLGSIAQGNSGGGMFGTTAPSRDQLSQYSQGRGSQFGDSSLNYWSNPQKWQELVQRGQQLQPGSDGSWYANKFLSNAEEFTGGAHQTAMNMWGSDPAEQQGGGNNQLMMLLQQLLGGQQQGPQGPRQQDLEYNQYKQNPQQMGYNGNTGIAGSLNNGSIPQQTNASMIGQNSGNAGGMIGGQQPVLPVQQMQPSQGLIDPARFGGVADPRFQY